VAGIAAGGTVSIRDAARVGFQRSAAAYERSRPGYPPEAVGWLFGQLRLGPGRTVLDVGAGTGKLTRELAASGADIVAVEPVPAMRAMLEQAVPAARALDGTAEALPIDDESIDAIAVAQAFHWFDVPRALAEFHRVLRPCGRFALIWNRRRLEQPIHREISAIIEPYRRDTPSHQRGEWRQPLASSGLFAPVADLELPTEQEVDVEGVVDRVGSTSFIGALPDPERAEVLSRVRDMAAGWGESLRLGYTTEAYV
jgi:SAM-dependent methyltransferase